MMHYDAQEMINVLTELRKALEKVNQSLELLVNPVFITDGNQIERLPRRPGSVLPFCKCGGLIEEKKDDSNL